MKHLFRSLMFSVILITPSLLFADTLSLTTYYPAPFGAYSMLKLTPQSDASMGACDAAKTGMIYLSSDTNEFKTCNGTTWGSVSPWSINLASKFVYLTNSDTDTSYKTGIGVSNPNTRLHVKGLDSSTNGQVEIESTENEAKLSLFNSAGSTPQGNGSISMSQVSGAEGLRFQIYNADKMILDENGNLGIGVTAPFTNLHVLGADNTSYGQLNVQSSGTDAHISLANSSSTLRTRNGHILMSSATGAEGLRFLINTSDAMIIDEAGNVGIGNTAPVALLDVSRTAIPTGNISIAQFDNINLLDDDDTNYNSNALCAGTNCTSTDTNFMGLRMFSDNTNTNTMTLGVPFATGYNSSVSLNVGNVAQLVTSRSTVVTDSSVNVGIGIDTPVYKLHVNGPIGGAIDRNHPASVGELQVDCQTVPGKCYATYAP